MEISVAAALFYPVLYFWDSTGWFCALAPAVLIHELGHYLAIRRCGGTVQRLRVGLTGMCMDTTVLFSPYKNALCAASGPLAGFLWAFGIGCLETPWAQASSSISLLLSGFNLLPVLPLDGGQILLALTGNGRLLRILAFSVPGALFFLSALLRCFPLTAAGAMILLVQFRT